MYQAFYPGRVWLDTEGKRIHAHGGSVMYIDGIYYWYGENKEKTTGQNGIWHWGVRCYTSKDLYNWKDEISEFEKNMERTKILTLRWQIMCGCHSGLKGKWAILIGWASGNLKITNRRWCNVWNLQQSG